MNSLCLVWAFIYSHYQCIINACIKQRVVPLLHPHQGYALLWYSLEVQPLSQGMCIWMYTSVLLVKKVIWNRANVFSLIFKIKWITEGLQNTWSYSMFKDDKVTERKKNPWLDLIKRLQESTVLSMLYRVCLKTLFMKEICNSMCLLDSFNSIQSLVYNTSWCASNHHDPWPMIKFKYDT